MKLVYVIIFFFLLGCASVQNGVSKIVYSDIIESLSIGISTELDVTKKLGVAASRIEKKDYYILNYNDSNGFQRVSFNFDKQTQKLTGYLWLPRENEKEISLVQVKSHFKDAQFKESKDDKDVYAQNIVLFVDEQRGVTIRFDKKSNIVEAIAEYGTLPRSPALNHK